MNAKLQALLYGLLSAASGYIAYFIALPPSLQTGMLGDIISIAPPSWQPALAGATKTISTIAGLYATYRAAQGGPHATPPDLIPPSTPTPDARKQQPAETK